MRGYKNLKKLLIERTCNNGWTPSVRDH